MHRTLVVAQAHHSILDRPFREHSTLNGGFLSLGRQYRSCAIVVAVAEYPPVPGVGRLDCSLVHLRAIASVGKRLQRVAARP